MLLRSLISILLCLIISKCNSNESNVRYPKKFTNSIGITFVKIPGGIIHPEKEKIEEFYLSTTEITNLQYEQFLPKHVEKRDIYSPGDNYPVIWVSYENAEAFTQWISSKEKVHYFLPSENQWRWAAQAGNREYLFATYDGSLSHNQANYYRKCGVDSFLYTSPVASFEPNPFGIYDMSGNVWEWCDDWFHKERTLHRVWLSFSWLQGKNFPFFWYGIPKKWRVLRGGSYNYDESLQRTDVRNAYKPWESSRSAGFRIALPLEEYNKRSN